MFPSAITAMPEQGVSAFPANGAGDAAAVTVPTGFEENLRLCMVIPPSGTGEVKLHAPAVGKALLPDAEAGLDPQMMFAAEQLGVEMPRAIMDVASLDTQAPLEERSPAIVAGEGAATGATPLPDETGEATMSLLPELATAADESIATPTGQTEASATPNENVEQPTPRSDSVTLPVQRPDSVAPQAASAPTTSEAIKSQQDMTIDDAPANKAQPAAQLPASDQGAADSATEKKPLAQAAVPESGIEPRSATAGQTSAMTLPTQPLGENSLAQSATATATTTASGSTGPMPQLQMTRPDWPATAVAATVTSLSADGGTMIMELSPEALGPLRITLTLEGDTATVRFQTETPEAARLLNEAERQLSTEFNRHGLTLGKHDAATSGQSQDQGQQSGQNAGKDHTADEPDIQLNTRLPVAGGVINLIA